MDTLRSRPGLTSIVAGLVVTALVFVVGGGEGLVGFSLAALVGAVFAATMYAAMRGLPSPPN
jgi:hypothetical protein